MTAAPTKTPAERTAEARARLTVAKASPWKRFDAALDAFADAVRAEAFEEMRAEMGPMCQRRMLVASQEGRSRDYACGISDGLVTAANWAEQQAEKASGR